MGALLKKKPSLSRLLLLRPRLPRRSPRKLHQRRRNHPILLQKKRPLHQRRKSPQARDLHQRKKKRQRKRLPLRRPLQPRRLPQRRKSLQVRNLLRRKKKPQRKRHQQRRPKLKKLKPRKRNPALLLEKALPKKRWRPMPPRSEQRNRMVAPLQRRPRKRRRKKKSPRIRTIELFSSATCPSPLMKTRCTNFSITTERARSDY